MAKIAKSGESYLYDQVAQLITHMIENGTLKPGDRVPSLRKLSKQLKVSIATVMQAYVQLEDKGIIESRPQSGFYVRASRRLTPDIPNKTTPKAQPRKVQFGNTVETIFSLANDSELVPLGVANPSADLLPIKGLNRALSHVLTHRKDDSVNYSFPPGDLNLRRQIAFRSADIGCELDVNDVVITTGCTEALAVSLKSVAKRGDIIAVESPTYFCVLQMIEKFGMLAVEIDTDPSTGICLDALETALETIDIKAVVTVGNFSNPTGALMPDSNKEQLVEMLAEREIPLVEDDIWGDLYFGEQRPRTCQTFDKKGLVVTVSSFSKSIAPGYRVGWVLPGRYRESIMQNKQLNSSAVASLPQMAIAEFLRTGHYDRHLARLRRAYKTQVDKLLYSIAEYFPEGTKATRPQGGFTMWVQLPRGIDTGELYQRALAEKISITPGMLFSHTGKYKNFMRLCAGHEWSDRIESGVKKLGDLAHEMNR